jgi:prefoldin subunit 5
MNNAVEQFPGQIKQLEAYIDALEKEIDMLRDRIRHLEAQTYGGSTQ